MLRFFLLFFIFTTPIIAPAQKSKNKVAATSSLDLMFGNILYQKKFYNQLNSISNFDFKKPVQVGGISVSGLFIVNRGYNYYGQMFFGQVIPAKIKLYDTLDCKLTGNMFSVSIAGINLFSNSDIVGLYISTGLSIGRLRIYHNDVVRMKNAFFSPTVSVQPKIALGPVVISFLATYSYDLSDDLWKKPVIFSGKKNHLSNFRQTSLNGFLCLGFSM